MAGEAVRGQVLALSFVIKRFAVADPDGRGIASKQTDPDRAMGDGRAGMAHDPTALQALPDTDWNERGIVVEQRRTEKGPSRGFDARP